MKSKNKPISDNELTKFGLFMAFTVMFLFYIVFPHMHYLEKNIIVIFISLLIILFAWGAPAFLKPLYFLWNFLGEILGYFNTRIILGVLYIFVIIPYSIYYKLSKRDPMQRVLSKRIISYRVDGQVLELNDNQF